MSPFQSSEQCHEPVYYFNLPMTLPP